MYILSLPSQQEDSTYPPSLRSLPQQLRLNSRWALESSVDPPVSSSVDLNTEKEPVKAVSDVHEAHSIDASEPSK